MKNIPQNNFGLLNYIQTNQLYLLTQQRNKFSEFVKNQTGVSIYIPPEDAVGNWIYLDDITTSGVEESDRQKAGIKLSPRKNKLGVEYYDCVLNTFKDGGGAKIYSEKEALELYQTIYLKSIKPYTYYNIGSEITQVNYAYFSKKGITQNEVPLLSEARIYSNDSSDLLIVPIRDIDGITISYQKIDLKTGDKKYASGFVKKGGFFIVGDNNIDLTSVDKVTICEGLATAISVNKISGETVLATLDCINMETVAKSLISRNRDISITVASDNDSKKKKNAGIIHSINICKLGSKHAYTFPTGIEGTDWNDCEMEVGMEKAKELYRENMKSKLVAGQAKTGFGGENGYAPKIKMDGSDTGGIGVDIPQFKNVAGMLCKINRTKKGELVFSPLYYGVITPIRKLVDDEATYYTLECITKEGTFLKDFDAAELSSGSSLAKAFSSSGLTLVTTKQGEGICEFLSFYIGNHKLPILKKTTNLGVTNDGGLVLEHESINTETEYLKKVNNNNSIDSAVDVIRFAEDFKKESDNWILRFATGLSLASPFVRFFQDSHLGSRFDRNPIAVFVGASNSGKTSVAKYITSLWGNAGQAPLKIEASADNTKVGLETTFSKTNGLTMFMDEIHILGNSRRGLSFESVEYVWANRQSRIYGSKLNEIKGGKGYSGVLVCAGERMPNLHNAGAFNRQIIFDISNEKLFEGGEKTSEMLKKATSDAFGKVGAVVYKYIQDNWDNYLESYEENITKIPLEDSMRNIGSLAITTWDYACRALLGSQAKGIDFICNKFASVINSQRDSENYEPSLVAWERLNAFLATASEKLVDNKGTGEFTVGGKVVFYKNSKGDICVPVRSDLMLKAVMDDPMGDISQHARKWLLQGKLRQYKSRNKDGRSVPTYSVALKLKNTNKNVRVLVIPQKEIGVLLDLQDEVIDLSGNVIS